MIEYIYEPKRIHGTFDESQTQEIHDRVKANLATIPESTCNLTNTDRLAAQHFFSQLTWLEKIASMAADKHEVVEGQLLDEAVHLLSFYSIAEHFGGIVPANKQVQALLDYIDAHEGVKSLILLNFFGESWIDQIFERVGTWGFVDGLLESIEEDEERHHQGALDDDEIIEQLGGMPDRDSLQNMARDLEKLLSDIMASPHFSFPMIYFGGEAEASLVGLEICDAHEKVCEHLGIDHDTKSIRKFCRGQKFLANRRPVKLEMNGWQRSKMNLWKSPAPMTGYFNATFNTNNPFKMQMALMKAVSVALMKEPRLNRVVRNDQLWAVQENVVGMRFAYDDEQVSTVYEKDAWRKTDRVLVRGLNNKIKRIRSKPFEEVIDMHDIVDILPPARCPVIINWSGSFGHVVSGPLNAIEGVPIQMMIGENWRDENGMTKATVTIVMDHRVGDGKDINLLGELVNSELLK